MSQRYGVPATAASFHPILGAVCSSTELSPFGSRASATAASHLPPAAAAVLRAMELAGVPAAPRTLTTVVQGLTKSRRLRDADALLGFSHRQSPSLVHNTSERKRA